MANSPGHQINQNFSFGGQNSSSGGQMSSLKSPTPSNISNVSVFSVKVKNILFLYTYELK